MCFHKVINRSESYNTVSVFQILIVQQNSKRGLQIQLLKKENTGVFKETLFLIFDPIFFYSLSKSYRLMEKLKKKDEEITSSDADTVTIGLDSDNTDSELSRLPAKEILLSEVTDEMKEQVNILKQIFVKESKNERLGSVSEILKLTVQEYADKLSNIKKTGLKTGYNLDSLKIETQGISIS